MQTIRKYKNYSRAYFAYIILSHLFLILTTTRIRIRPEMAEIGITFGMFVSYTIFIYIAKSISFIRQNNVSYHEYDYHGGLDYARGMKLPLIFVVPTAFGTWFYILFFMGYANQIIDTINAFDYPLTVSIIRILRVSFPIILIWWDIKRLLFNRVFKKETIQKNRREEQQYAKQMDQHYNRKNKSKEYGTMTGYEPKELENIDLIPSDFMRGQPGAGLSGSGFSKSNIQSGALGELNFAKTLQIENLLNRFASYWSVQYPGKYSAGPDTSSQGDIDCVLISKKHVYLVDLKLYAQGDVTWKIVGNKVVAVDNVTGEWVKEPRKMSKNMFYATERVQKKMDKLGVKLKVKPYVVMMPTDRGLGEIDNVYWPGNIKCLTLIDFLKQLKKEKPLNPNSPEFEVLDDMFTWLTKDESGSAPKDYKYT